jgi:hypothetical protein
MKKFTVGKHDTHRYFICVDMKNDMTFSVWRDLFRISGHSYHGMDHERFEFSSPEKLEEGKKVLFGALFEEDLTDTK